MAEIGHNNPPEPLTAKVKLQRIEAIIEREDLTAAQKCVGVGIVVKADRDGVAEAKTQELMDFASVKDRETVFRATKTLHEKEIIEKANKKGQSGRYNVMPAKVIEEIIAARDKMVADGLGNQAAAGRVKPDGIDKGTGRVSPDQSENDAVGFEPTPAKPVGFEPTGSQQDAPARVDNPTHATKESPTEIVITKTSPNGEGVSTRPPHMNGVGFVISGERKAIIPAETVSRWLERFPNIPDLEAAMGRLSCNLLSNVGHPGWSCPEGWMAGILSDINQNAKDKKQAAEAKIARAQKGELPAWKADINDKLARMRAANK